MTATTVDTVTCTTAVSGRQRRGCFFTKGRHFEFYVHAASSGRFKWKSSTNPGAGWDTPASPLVVDLTITTFHKCDVFLKNETTVGVVYIDSSGHLHWKEGTIEVDESDVATGEITWGTESINILADGLSGRSGAFYPSLWYDGDGHAWIAVTAVYASYPTYYELDVWRNGNTDGTWSKTFVVTVVTAYTDVVYNQVFGFSGSTGYVLYATTGTCYIKGKTISATGTLGSEEDASDTTYYPVNSICWNAVAKGDDVFLAWKTHVAGSYLYHFLFRIRTGGSWGSWEEVVDTGSNLSLVPALCVDATGNVYLFFLDSIVSPRVVRYYCRTGAGWAELGTLASAEAFSDGINIQVSVTVNSYILSVSYLTFETNRYVKHDFLDLTPAPPASGADFVQVM